MCAAVSASKFPGFRQSCLSSRSAFFSCAHFLSSATVIYTYWFAYPDLSRCRDIASNVSTDDSATRSFRLKILVCMKQVPQKDAPLKLNESGAWIREDVSYEVNEPDAYALEEALRQKEKHGGEVVVITTGPARAQQVLREALAKGADRPIHLEDNAFLVLAALNTAPRFARPIQCEK